MSIGVVDICGVCMRISCTVVTQNQPDIVYSTKFHFQGNEWRFYYLYGIRQHLFGLNKMTNVDCNQLDVFVRLECVGTGPIRTVLPQLTRFKDEFKNNNMLCIWVKNEEDIQRDVPEFSLYKVLKFIVVLKIGDGDFLNRAGCDPTVPEIKCSATETTRPTTRSISIQTTLLPNTMPCFESLSEDLGQLMIEGSDHDVEFLCGGQSTKAHKSIVCSRSPVIASMLTSDMVEGRTGVVTIPDMEPEVFKHFLKYIYCGQLPELSVDLAISLFESGDQYAVLGLAKRCSEYLVEHLSEENACRVLVVADAHSNEDLKESVIDFILDREIPLSTGGDWQDFCDAHSKLANKVFHRFCLKLKQS